MRHGPPTSVETLRLVMARDRGYGMRVLDGEARSGGGGQ
jgi:hypothetical protein